MIRPAVVSEREWAAADVRVRGAHPGRAIEVWDEREHSGSDILGLLRVGRRRFRGCIIVRGAEPLGYARARLVAALVGAPTEFEGRTWSRLALLSALGDLALLAARGRAVGLLSRLNDAGAGLATASRSLGAFFVRLRPPHEGCCSVCGAKVPGRGRPGMGGRLWRCGACGTFWVAWRTSPRVRPGRGDVRRCRELRACAETFAYLKRCEALAAAPPERVLEITGVGDSPCERPSGTACLRRDAAALMRGDLASSGFDVVLAVDALAREGAPARFLCELAKVCAPGAAAMLRAPDAETVRAAPEALVADGRMTVVPRDLLERLCRSAGFRVAAVDHLMDPALVEVWLVRQDESLH